MLEEIRHDFTTKTHISWSTRSVQHFLLPVWKIKTLYGYSPTSSIFKMTSPDVIDFLQHARGDSVHDLIGVGFGPASLAIAVAIYDVLEQRTAQSKFGWTPRLKFLERQSSFGWHAGMLLPGTKMQISFLKDLATMRNPRSHFTFLNYLKHHNRLVQFSNLDTFLPLRIEFEDYLKWSARHFEEIVQYSQDVVSIRPLKLNSSTKYNCLEVISKNNVSGKTTLQRGKNVIIAVGGRPSIPKVFRIHDERLIHSSKYDLSIGSVLPDKQAPYTIAVVGAGQSAAEVFNDLHTRYPRAKTLLLMRDTAMRPSDDSPFVNEVFNPEVIDEFYATSPEARSAQLKVNKATNYSVVRLPLLEQLYEHMYHQRMQDPDHENWPSRILPSREVIDVRTKPKDPRLDLVINAIDSCSSHETTEVVPVDAVVLATGYIRDVHTTMLKGCQAINGNSSGEWTADRNYRVQLNRNLVDEDIQVYLQGCNEKTHGLSDTLLSILATRGGEIVDSVFGNAMIEADTRDLIQRTTSNVNGPLGPLWKLHKPHSSNGFNEQKRCSAVQESTAVKA